MELSSKERSELRKHMKKVLSAKEKPFDGLRVRTILLLTHKPGGTEAFIKMSHFHYQTFYSNRFSAWKYCNLLHMAIRYGSSEILKTMQSMGEQQKINDLANYWCRKNDAIDVCIVKYLKLLIYKSQFHNNFTFFNGALEADITKEWNVNLCYQLCTDIFDYLDRLLSLQQSIFSNLTLQQISIGAPETECRLQPLINIAAECNTLYNQAMVALSVICSKLSPDYIVGLRNRFCELHQMLHGFYASLEQVKFLLKMENIPELSSSIPGFGVVENVVAACDSCNSLDERQPTAPPMWELE